MVVSIPRIGLRFGALIVAAAVAGACGQKGPPLVPFVRIPAAVENLTVRRVGVDVYVTLVLPVENIDASTPVVIDRVDVLAYTGAAPPAPGQWGELGTRIARLSTESANQSLLGPGGRIGVVDHLSAADRAGMPQPLTPMPAPDATAERDAAAPLSRFYTAFAFDPRGRPSPPGTVAATPLAELNVPVTALTATYTETVVRLAWQPIELGAPPTVVPPEVSTESPPIPAGGYNVYQATRGVSSLLPANRPATVSPPQALNPEPLVQTAFDAAVEFGVERCYLVRAVNVSGDVESLASAPACLTAIDRFPPAAPSGLIANGTADGVSLIWNANQEPDLGGYLVLRSSSDEVAQRALTPAPIQSSRFLDATAAAGVQYRYTVVAVDRQVPESNRSEPSATVTAIGR